MNSETAQRIGITVAVCFAAWGFTAPAFGGTHPAGTPQASADHRVRVTSRVGGAVGVRSTSIVGVAWNADDTPIPGARLRLRDVVTGRVASTAASDEAGRFTFGDVEPGSYLIELVTDGDKIVALGHTFTVARGETVATFVRIGARVPWYTGFFGNAASAIASTAASAGVTAIAPEAKPCSSPSPGCI